MMLAEILITEKQNDRVFSPRFYSKYTPPTQHGGGGGVMSYVSSISLAISNLLILLGAISITWIKPSAATEPWRK